MRAFRRAGWWRRAFAWILDAFITAIPVSVIVTLAGFGAHQVHHIVRGKVVSTATPLSIEAQLLELGLWLTAQVLYYGLAEGMPRGQSFGKRWMGIATVDASDGRPVGHRRAAARALICSGSLCCLLLPGLVDISWPLFDPDRSALHDRLTNTAVIEVLPA